MNRFAWVEKIIFQHLEYLKKENYLGWDVFDGLNSRLLRATPLYKSRLVRLAWIQWFKRSPFNWRPFFAVPKGDNPKALALFISGLINLYKVYREEKYLKESQQLYQRLMDTGAQTNHGLGWGYNFPWQARAFYVPAFKPNMIASVFAGHALLDLLGATNDQTFLEQAEKVAAFILGELILFEDDQTLCFGYIPGETAVVHNANLLGAGFLSRLYALNHNQELRDIAEKSVRYSVKAQREDGAWVYGERGHHQWVDNFHTGYNLMAIHQFRQFTQNDQFEPAVEKGLDFHLKNHFTDQYLPKYTDTQLYPLDIHCFSQAILTFLELKDRMADAESYLNGVLKNVIELFYDSEQKYFYYQRTRYYTIKIPYIRWSQAWMFFSLSELLERLNEK